MGLGQGIGLVWVSGYQYIRNETLNIKFNYVRKRERERERESERERAREREYVRDRQTDTERSSLV